jgi:hypothetical protein
LRLTPLPANSSTVLGISLCILLFLSGFSAESSAGDFSLSGYFKSYLYVYKPSSTDNSIFNAGTQSAKALSTNRLRLHLSYEPSAWISMDAAYDIVPSIRSKGFSQGSLLFGQINPFIYRAVDLDSLLYPSQDDSIEHFAVNQNLDRAMVTIRTTPADIIIGRQPIAWGSARAVNPTDVLAPFSFETLDTEDRIGIDAVRARIPLGTLSEIDAGYVIGKDLKSENSAFYGRAAFNAHNTDVSLLVMDFRENLLVGMDLAGALGGAGFYIETAFVSTDAFTGRDAALKENYFGASTGIDYSFGANSYVFLEYHYNGAGAADPRDYLGNYTKPAYTEGSVYLMGRHYLIPGAMYQLTPLLSLSASTLINLTDPSFFITPQLDYNITSNGYISAGTFIGIGKKPETTPGGNPVLLRSEFGGYPNIFFGSFRYYF